MNDEGRRHSAPRDYLNTTAGNDTRHVGQPPTVTPLQVVLEKQAQVFELARELLDERGYDFLVDVLTTRAAHDNRLRLERQVRRAT